MDTLSWEDGSEDPESDQGEESDIPDDLEFMLYSQLHYEEPQEDQIVADSLLQRLPTAVKNSNSGNKSANILSKSLPEPKTVNNTSTSTNSFLKSVSDILLGGNRTRSDKKSDVSSPPNENAEDKKGKKKVLKRLKDSSSESEKGNKKRKIDSKRLQKIIMIDSSSSSSDVEIIDTTDKNSKNLKETVIVEHDSVLEPRTSFITISSESSESSCEIMQSNDVEDSESDEFSGSISGSSDSDSKSCSSVDITSLQVHVDPGQAKLLKPSKETDEHREKWKINEEDRLAHIIRHRQSPGKKFGGTGIGGRYYRPSSVKCLNCNEIGHLSKDCPKPKKSEICIMCGYTGHYFRDCPQSLCYNCNLPGHTAKECTERRQWRYQECQRCSMMGHGHKVCPERWRQFHLTTEMSKGCPVKGQAHVNFRRSCYNCASKKHFGFECPRERVDRYSSPTYPLIAKYDAWNFIKTLIHPELSQEEKQEKKRQKRKEMRKQKKLKKKMEAQEIQYEEETNFRNPAQKPKKKKSKSKNWDSKFSSCTETGKLFKNSKKKRQQANNWRNKQGTSGSAQRSNKGFHLSSTAQFAHRKMNH